MVTTLYAGILGIIYIILAAFVIQGRIQNKISLSDGNNNALLGRIRAHANFGEYVPLALILMILSEFEGASVLFLHILGSALIISRVLHALGLYNKVPFFIGRSLGMVITLLVILSACGFCIKSYFFI